jgi:S-adenosylmethionine hydrolase
LRQDASQAGVRVLKPVLLPPEAPRESEHGIWTGRVVWIDHFGNCITNFNTEEFGERMRSQTFRLRLGPLTITRIEATYGSQKAGEPLAYWGSAGRLEIGINQGSAAIRGELQVGNRVELEFRN